MGLFSEANGPDASLLRLSLGEVGWTGMIYTELFSVTIEGFSVLAVMLSVSVRALDKVY